MGLAPTATAPGPAATAPGTAGPAAATAPPAAAGAVGAAAAGPVGAISLMGVTSCALLLLLLPPPPAAVAASAPLLLPPSPATRPGDHRPRTRRYRSRSGCWCSTAVQDSAGERQCHSGERTAIALGLILLFRQLQVRPCHVHSARHDIHRSNDEVTLPHHDNNMWLIISYHIIPYHTSSHTCEDFSCVQLSHKAAAHVWLLHCLCEAGPV